MKRKFGSVAVGVLTKFLYLFASLLFSKLVIALAMRIMLPLINSFCDAATSPIYVIVRMILMIAVATAICGAVAYFEGLRLSKYPVKTVITETLLAIPFFFGFSILFGFGEWVCGPVKIIAGLLYFGADMNNSTVVRTANVPLWTFVTAWVTVVGLCTAAIIGLFKYGRIKRAALNEELYREAEAKRNNTKVL